MAYRNGAPVILSDVANVIDGLENAKVGGCYQGAPAVIIDIQRQPGANVIETVRRIGLELPRLRRAMPKGISLTVVQDRTATIRASVHDVQFTLLLSVFLVVMVVFLFLRTVRATIIAGVALPLSLIATFGVMWFLGFSLDNLSLMALTIGTGFVVDDAIVMIENIVRHMEEGEEPFDAAMRGAKEIGFTVISLTVSLVAVFIPLLFMGGIVGRMFREFALTLTVAVVTSAIVSLTLTPMMCSRLLRHDGELRDNAVTRFFNGVIDRAVTAYHRSLEWVLRHERATLAVTFATLVATVWLYVIIPKGFLPIQDTGLITAVTEAGPEVSFVEMQRLQQRIVAAVRADPDVTGVVSVVGVTPMNRTANAGRLAITLKPRDDRASFVTAIVDRLKRAVAAVPGMVVYFQPVQDIQIGTRASPRAVSVQPDRDRCGGGLDLGGPAGGAPARRSAAARCRFRSPGRRIARRHQGRPREGRPARHLHAGDQRHPQRRLRPAPDLDHLRPGQPVPGDPGGDAGIPARPQRRSPSSICRRERSTAQPTLSSAHLEPADPADGFGQPGAAERRRDGGAHHRAARHHARGAVPGRHAELQPGAGRRARRRGRRHLRRGSRHRHARHGDRQLFRRCRRVREVARRRAVADPRGGGDDLHRARHAL